MEENKEIKEEVKVKDTKKEPVKKSIPMYVYVIGIVVVLILILIISLAVVANSDDEVPVEEPTTEEKVEEKDPSKLTDKDAKKIFEEALPYIEDYEGTTIYHNDKMMAGNANTEFLRAFAYSKIEFKEGDLTPYKNVDGTDMCGENGCTHQELLNKGWYTFSPTLLQEKSMYYYGAEVVNGKFVDRQDAVIEYKENMYSRSVLSTSTALSHHYREYVSFEVVEDTLYITDKYLYIYGVVDSKKDNYLITLYGDSAKKNRIGGGTYLIADNLVDLIVPNYERKKVTYKHAFKKASDGHWYWISTVQVK